MSSCWARPRVGRRHRKRDADFDKLARDFIGGYLAARPLHGRRPRPAPITTARSAISAGWRSMPRSSGFSGSRTQLNKIEAGRAEPARRTLTAGSCSRRSRGELFQIEDMGIFETKPDDLRARRSTSTSTSKRDFKPLEDRVRDIVTIEDQTSQYHDRRQRRILPTVLPKPYVELAIQIANGSADFLERTCAAAVEAM